MFRIALVCEGPSDRAILESILDNISRTSRPTQSKDGELKNQAEGYRAQGPKLEKGWAGVRERCGQAARFHEELETLLAGQTQT